MSPPTVCNIVLPNEDTELKLAIVVTNSRNCAPRHLMCPIIDGSWKVNGTIAVC